jgi:colanic acid/amylovoran biosynthesis protein
MKTIRICLLWHKLEAGNLGVSALSVGQILLLERISRTHNIKFEYTTVGTRSVKNMDARKHLSNVIKKNVNHIDYDLSINIILGLILGRGLFDKFDYVMDIGEGDSFSDIYGLKRFLWQFISKLHVIRCNTPLILAPQTYGPYSSYISKLLSNFVFKKAHSIFSRDKESMNIVNKSGAKCYLTTDVAMAIPIDKFVKPENARHLSIGINISGLLFNNGYSGENEFGIKLEYRKFIENLLLAILKRKRTCVHFVPHVLNKQMRVEDDMAASEKVAEDLKNSLSQSQMDRIKIAPQFSNPVQAISYIAQMDFFIGSRMHSTIAALNNSIAVVPVAYSKKFLDLFDNVQYPYVIDARQLGTDEAVSQIMDYFDDISRLQMCASHSKHNANTHIASYISALEEIFLGRDH